jgi:hypothetical protein
MQMSALRKRLTRLAEMRPSLKVLLTLSSRVTLLTTMKMLMSLHLSTLELSAKSRHMTRLMSTSSISQLAPLTTRTNTYFINQASMLARNGSCWTASPKLTFSSIVICSPTSMSPEGALTYTAMLVLVASLKWGPLRTMAKYGSVRTPLRTSFRYHESRNSTPSNTTAPPKTSLLSYNLIRS